MVPDEDVWVWFVRLKGTGAAVERREAVPAAASVRRG